MGRLEVETIYGVRHLRLSLGHLTKGGTLLVSRVTGIEICWLWEIHHVVSMDEGEITRIRIILSFFTIMVESIKGIMVFESLIGSHSGGLGPELLTVSV